MAGLSYWPTDLEDVEPFNSGDAQYSMDGASGGKHASLSRMITKFKAKKLKDWEREDIVDWVLHTCKENHIDSETVNVSGFAAYSGAMLMEITEDQVINIEPVYGRELFMALRLYQHFKTSGVRLVSQSSSSVYSPEMDSPHIYFDQYADDSYNTYDSGAFLPGDSHGLSADNMPNRYYSSSPCKMLEDLSLSSGDSLSPFSQYDSKCNQYPSYDNNDGLGHCGDAYTLAELSSEDLAMLDTPDDMGALTPAWDLIGADLSVYQSEGGPSHQTMNLRKVSEGQDPRGLNPATLNSMATQIDRRRRTASSSSGMSPRSSSPCKRKSSSKPKSSSSSSSSRSAAGGKRKERGKKVWEFLLDLLKNPETNPNLIRWEDEEQGIFRLVEHEIIAQKWGERRDRSDMSYDYFARTMRYQYTTGMLESVPERKLVFRFGPDVMQLLRHLP